MLNENADAAIVAGGLLDAPDARRGTLDGKRFVFTSAQNNTALHEGFYHALLEYCDANEAELVVSRFTYNKSRFGKKSVKPGSKAPEDDDPLWYDPRLAPHFRDESLEVAPGLVWCGELNILPTAANPLNSLKSYTRSASSIIPHVKVAMQSVPTMKGADPKFMYTTGAITARNYIEKKAGQVADFHHVFGALVVEIDSEGVWFARHIVADRFGCFYDLDWRYTPDGHSYSPACVEALTHGDIHFERLDWGVADVVWGRDGLMACLEPKQQHFHDLIDFRARNHHNLHDPHFLFQMRRERSECIQKDIRDAAAFLDWAGRDGCRSVVIESNHDQALMRWLREPRAQFDPANMRYWHECNARVLRWMERGANLSLFEYELKKAASKPFKFVREDESFVICGKNGIECGLHGHRGPNGARGSPQGFRIIGSRTNTAHTHSAGILEGVYTAGVYGQLDMGYNAGPSSWSHSCILTYRNGKRCILTLKRGKWRA